MKQPPIQTTLQNMNNGTEDNSSKKQISPEVILSEWESKFHQLQNDNIGKPKPHFFEAPKEVMKRLFPFVGPNGYVAYKGVIVCAEGDLDAVQSGFWQ